MSIVNAYTIAPHEIEPGNVMLFVVKAMVMYDGTYRIYRCPYDGPEDVDALPQGGRIDGYHEIGVAEALFPTLADSHSPDLSG